MQNNNNNNNNDNNNNDNNVNVANNNNLAGNVNQVMFLPAIGRRKRSPLDPEYSRLAIAAIKTFVELEGCGSLSCRASLLCGGQSKAGKIDAVAEHLLEGSRRYFNLTSVQC